MRNLLFTYILLCLHIYTCCYIVFYSVLLTSFFIELQFVNENHFAVVTNFYFGRICVNSVRD